VIVRNEFHRELELLRADLAAMCDLAGGAIERATRGLLDVDAEAAGMVLADAKRSRALHKAVERCVVSLLARQAPVAGDLRAVVSAIHIAADADRMSGLAAHVARVCLRCHPDSAIPDEMRTSFAQMGRIACELAELSSASAATCECVPAERIHAGGPTMDELHRGLFAVVMSPEWRHPPVVATNVVLLARFYGRFADHAEEIVRRMRFQVTGTYRAELVS
jgi:phosphate transport system protein